ncbi:MAG: hypothetical protein EPN30_03805 [Actinomycetota bacterium]|nr:MAG: hypothetical protein EPN30_03805 [Actinomycetota bacterium]
MEKKALVGIATEVKEPKGFGIYIGYDEMVDVPHAGATIKAASLTGLAHAPGHWPARRANKQQQTRAALHSVPSHTCSLPKSEIAW